MENISVSNNVNNTAESIAKLTSDRDNITCNIKRINPAVETDHYINRDEVFGLLKLNGFKVLNMTEINGVTYFYSQMVAERVELRA